MDKNFLTVKKKTIIIAINLGVGTIVTFIFMMLFALIMTLFSIDRSFALPFATVSGAIGCFVAAFFSSKKIGDKGYLTGAAVGIGSFLLVLIISLIFNTDSFSKNTVFHLIIMILSSLIGGIFGVNKGKNKKYI